MPEIEQYVKVCSYCGFWTADEGLAEEHVQTHRNNPPGRERFHTLLDRAMDLTEEGKSFLGTFVDLLLAEVVL